MTAHLERAQVRIASRGEPALSSSRGEERAYVHAENKALVRQYFEVFHNQRPGLDLGEQILESELLTPTLGMATMMRAAFPDYQITIDDQLAEADKVATVWTASAPTKGNGRVRLGRWHRRAKQ